MALKSHGLGHLAVSSRPKALDSFLKKIIRKGYEEPLVQTGDLVGIRVVAPTRDLILPAETALGDCFELTDRDDKAGSLLPHEFGYTGVHFVARLREPPRERALELQILTRAEALWAEVAHDTIYKPLGDEVQVDERPMYRLRALLEVFDAEVEVLKRQMPDWCAVLAEAEKAYYRFATAGFDRAISALVLTALVPADPVRSVGEIGVRLQGFVLEQEDKLKNVFMSPDAPHGALLFQPETIYVFEWLERDVHGLRDTWVHKLPIELLEELSLAWGTALPGLE